MDAFGRWEEPWNLDETHRDTGRTCINPSSGSNKGPWSGNATHSDSCQFLVALDIVMCCKKAYKHHMIFVTTSPCTGAHHITLTPTLILSGLRLLIELSVGCTSVAGSNCWTCVSSVLPFPSVQRANLKINTSQCVQGALLTIVQSWTVKWTYSLLYSWLNFWPSNYSCIHFILRSCSFESLCFFASCNFP